MFLFSSKNIRGVINVKADKAAALPKFSDKLTLYQSGGQIMPLNMISYWHFFSIHQRMGYNEITNSHTHMASIFWHVNQLLHASLASWSPGSKQICPLTKVQGVLCVHCFLRLWKNNCVSRKPCKRMSDLVLNGQMRVPK